MFDPEHLNKAGRLLALCRSNAVMISTAESCTGGLLASLLTETAGSSKTFERGFVTYSNEAKNELLGVPMELIEQHGAVSPQVAAAMAGGCLKNSRADLAVSITGIAGPQGGSAAKPVGLVYLACTGRNSPLIQKKCLFGDKGRSPIRVSAVLVALDLLLAGLEKHNLFHSNRS